MKPRIKFHKMVSAGNDFLVVDHRKRFLRNAAAFARKVCEPHYGLGADGVVLLERSKKSDLLMRIFNADGSEAEMCGNATRCAALYADRILKKGKRIALETRSGAVETQIRGARVRSRFSNPTDYRSQSHINVEGGSYSFYFVNTGVPHVVIFTKRLQETPVVEIGRAVRHHKHFAPKGTNVNFIQVKNRHALDIRTYERGVENETLACGTGSAAAAIVSVLAGLCQTPVTVRTRSGECMVVNFKHSRFQVTDVTVEGPAQFICEGILE